MGVTIRCKKTGTNYDLGYGGFANFREKVAELCSPEFGAHYAKLDEGFSLSGEERRKFYEDFDNGTLQLISDGKVSVKIVDFCLQSDCDGKIRYGACKVIYNAIKDYDDSICYGYAGRSDCTMFSDLKELFRECVENKSDLVWY